MKLSVCKYCKVGSWRPKQNHAHLQKMALLSCPSHSAPRDVTKEKTSTNNIERKIEKEEKKKLVGPDNMINRRLHPPSTQRQIRSSVLRRLKKTITKTKTHMRAGIDRRKEQGTQAGPSFLLEHSQ